MSHDRRQPQPATAGAGRTMMRIGPTGDALGAEVQGIDVRAIETTRSRRFIAPGWIIRCCCFAIST